MSIVAVLAFSDFVASFEAAGGGVFLSAFFPCAKTTPVKRHRHVNRTNMRIESLRFMVAVLLSAEVYTRVTRNECKQVGGPFWTVMVQRRTSFAYSANPRLRKVSSSSRQFFFTLT